MAFLGSLIAGVGAVATAVAPVVTAYQTVSSLFRPAIQQPPTPNAWMGAGRYWGMPRYRWQTPEVRAYAGGFRESGWALETPSVRATQINPTYVPMKIDWLGGEHGWH